MSEQTLPEPPVTSETPQLPVAENLPSELNSGETGSAGPDETAMDEQDLTDSDENNFTKEDVLLYIFCALLLTFMGLFFWTTQNQLEQALNKQQEAEAAISIIPPSETDAYRAYLHAQTIVSSKRYQQGARILLTTSTRKNTGFLIGSLLAFMGCIIVIRRVRKMGITAEGSAGANAQFKVITSSPGLFVALLGTLIILSTIIRYDSFDITDAVIVPPGQSAGSSNATIPDTELKKVKNLLGEPETSDQDKKELLTKTKQLLKEIEEASKENKNE
jgi:hypothetical protein